MPGASVLFFYRVSDQAFHGIKFLGVVPPRSGTKTPTFVDLIVPTLRALHELGGVASMFALDEAVIKRLDLPKDVVDQAHDSPDYRTELNYRLAWARTYLKKYGLITNPQRAVWELTAQGRRTQNVDPQEIARFYRQRTRER